MDNPLEQPAPEDPIARVHVLARDLAWGAINGKWTGYFRVFSPSDWIVMKTSNREYDQNIQKYIQEKWKGNPPECTLLLSLGYCAPDFENPTKGIMTFSLIEKAFNLLERPAVPPKIFISYRQNESSAFASLIEARLSNHRSLHRQTDRRRCQVA